VIFITHDIDEAIYLADRTVVLGTDAGNVLDDVHVDLPRERGPDVMQSAKFIAIRERVSHALHSTAGPAVLRQAS
jgi:ABC-type nitrate/sulfonate/bicarbonate transport system ATPase subunit